MTRAEVLAIYNVNEKGIITSPGKFELAPIFLPAFWESVLHGFANEGKDGNALINVGDEDRKEFPELGTMEQIGLWEEEIGFVRWYDATVYVTKVHPNHYNYGPTREECEKLAAEREEKGATNRRTT